MGRREMKFSWGSALVGAGAATATALVLSAMPRDPTFLLISIDLTSFKLSFPVLDLETTLTVQVTNPNVAPIRYSKTEMFIYYAGSLLGSASVEAGSQAPRSCQLLHLPARLSGLQLAHHAKDFLADVARREMVLDSTLEISGTFKVLWWNHGFKVNVDSHVIVDPVHFDVIDQDIRSKMEMFVDS